MLKVELELELAVYAICLLMAAGLIVLLLRVRS